MKKLQGLVPARSRQALMLAVLLIGSVASFTLIRHYVVGFVEISGSSVTPNLEQGQIHILHKWRLLTGEPVRGTIVAIRDPIDDDFSVKRIIGLPLERIDLKDDRVYIDDSLFEEVYVSRRTITRPLLAHMKSFELGTDEFFLLGDHREDSVDSRFYGPVTKDRIVGMIYP